MRKRIIALLPFFHSPTRPILILAMVVVIGLSLIGLRPVLSTDAPVITTTCTTLTPNPARVTMRTSGTVLFTCGTGPAVTATHPGGAVPRFALSAGYTFLTIVAHRAGATSCIQGSTLISGQEFSFTGKGGFDYCALYANPPTAGLASFTLTWSRR